MPQLVWAASPDGRIDFLSARAKVYTGLSEGEVLDQGWVGAIHPDDVEATRASFRRSIKAGTPHDVEHRIRRADGEYRWFASRTEPVRDSAGRIVQWIGSSTDVTSFKLIEAERERSRQAAEAANRAKDEVLTHVSHEIRNPMNAILGMTRLLLEQATTEDQKRLLSTVDLAARSLLGVIDDLLDFSKIAAGKLALDPAEFSLRELVFDALCTLAACAHGKGLELIGEVKPNVPDVLFGDAGRLRQVLLNLVGNAIKFTAEGEVQLEVSTVSAPPGERRVALRFTIRDTGIGIAPDKIDSVFRAFEQEDRSTTRRFGGTGLGLTISAQLAELMGGTVAVQSEPGHGSTFDFTARFAPSSQAKATAVTPSPALEHLPVLVVDDNESSRKVLLTWLTNWHLSARAVPGARSAVAELDRAEASGAPYALVLVDQRMPDVDGLALASEIVERYGPLSKRLILLSSCETPTLTARARDVGIHASVPKPIREAELLRAIGAAMYAPPEPRNDPVVEVASALGSTLGTRPVALHVLVAEDNELNATLLRELLSRRGHRIQVVGDGRTALALAIADAFDLMVLDLHMPEMDGFEVVKAVREQERATNGHLPTIALTARASTQDRERCLASGVDHVLSKPIEAEALWAAIARVTAGRRR